MSSEAIEIEAGSVVDRVDADLRPRALKPLDLVWSAALVLLLSFVTAFVVAFVPVFLHAASGGAQGLDGTEVQAYFDLPEGVALLNMLVFACTFFGTIASLAYFARRRGVRFADLGFRLAAGRYFGFAIISLIIVLVSGTGLNFLLDEVELEKLNTANEGLLITEGPMVYVSLLLIVVCIPFAEELFFRAALYGAFTRYVPRLVAAVLATLFFTGLHTQYVSLGGMAAFVGLWQIFLLGGLLSWLYISSRSIWPPVALHVMNNGIAFLAAYYLT